MLADQEIVEVETRDGVLQCLQRVVSVISRKARKKAGEDFCSKVGKKAVRCREAALGQGSANRIPYRAISTTGNSKGGAARSFLQ
jgi:hypothetical protein